MYGAFGAYIRGADVFLVIFVLFYPSRSRHWLWSWNGLLRRFKILHVGVFVHIASGSPYCTKASPRNDQTIGMPHGTPSLLSNIMSNTQDNAIFLLQNGTS